MDLRAILVHLLVAGSCVFCVAADCVDQICNIRNCTQNPREGIEEGMFYCSISSQEGCNKLKEKFQDQKGGSSGNSHPPVLRRVTLYPFEKYSALNFTFQLPSGTQSDLPATEAIKMNFWSTGDEKYQNLCKVFNFSPQQVTLAIPAREITYCNITGLSRGTLKKRETLYYLTLTAFPSQSSITYHMIYQGWTDGELARLLCNSNSIWKPLVAAARWPLNGNIHVVVETPPPEFSVEEIQIALFCGKRPEEEGILFKTITRNIYKGDSYLLIGEFENLPQEKCAVKVTPKCSKTAKCQESWSAWLDPELPPPEPPVVRIVVPLLLSLLVMAGILGFLSWMFRKKLCPPKSNCLTLVSVNAEGRENIVDAFARLLEDALGFKVKNIGAHETVEDNALLQCQLQKGKVIVLLCFPKSGQHDHDRMRRSMLLHLLERDEDLRSKCTLGCLTTSSPEDQRCQHFLDSGEEEGGGRDDGERDEEQLLSSAFPNLAATIRGRCSPLAGMDEEKFRDFCSNIISIVGSNQPCRNFEDGSAWYDLQSMLDEPETSSDSDGKSEYSGDSEEEDNNISSNNGLSASSLTSSEDNDHATGYGSEHENVRREKWSTQCQPSNRTSNLPARNSVTENPEHCMQQQHVPTPQMSYGHPHPHYGHCSGYCVHCMQQQLGLTLQMSHVPPPGVTMQGQNKLGLGSYASHLGHRDRLPNGRTLLQQLQPHPSHGHPHHYCGHCSGCCEPQHIPSAENHVCHMHQQQHVPNPSHGHLPHLHSHCNGCCKH